MGYKYKTSPKKNIDKNQFEGLCKLQCTLDEISGWFKVSPDTIENWAEFTYNMKFSEVFKIHAAEGKISLRRTQFRMAETSTAMAIFLGKQYLGQRDSVEHYTGDNGVLGELTKYLKGKEQDKETTEDVK